MRLFVAVELPERVEAALDAAREAAAPSIANARWVPRDNLHLTLAFLGSAAPDRVGEIAGALEGVARGVPTFEARLGGSGAFPSAKRARVLWAGLEGAILPVLASRVGAALAPLGFPAEERPWTAHVTLARLRPPQDLSGVLPLPLAAEGFPVSSLTLFHSRPGGAAPPRYEPLARVSLAP